MKRYFVFIDDDVYKEAPASLKETPAVGTGVIYNSCLYVVVCVYYDMKENIINIGIEKKTELKNRKNE